MQSDDYTNNFDLLRLFAAVQVIVFHAIEHFHVESLPWLEHVKKFIGFFPGVPIFFVMSGFLVAWSYQRSSHLKKFFFNRAVRIFPGLWVCFLFTVGVLFYFDILTLKKLVSPKVLAWVGTQVTFFPFYTPSDLRGFGLGNPNGNLWTIAVELQFYVVVPVLFFFLTRAKKQSNKILVFILFMLFSLAFNASFHLLPKGGMLEKLLCVTFLPHVYNFVLGAMLFYFFGDLRKWIEGKFLYWLGAFLLYIGLFGYAFALYKPSYFPNFWGLLSTILLSVMTLSFAYSYKTLSEKIVRGQDFSYGLYLYHGVVLNIMIHMKLKGKLQYIGILLGISFLFAILSWNLIEKQALRLKKKVSFAKKESA